MFLLNAQNQDAVDALEALQSDIEKIKPNRIIETMESWIPGLVHLGYRLIIALIILFIGRKIIKMILRMINRSFDKAGTELSVRQFLESLINAGLYGLLIFMAAEKVGFPETSIIALLGSAGLAIGLAVQGTLSNFAGGVLLLMLKPFKIGDYVISTGVEGTITAIGLFYTTLITFDNKTVVIPNGILSNSTLTNVTAQDKRRIDITVGIGYHSDLKRAKEILIEVLQSHPNTMKEEDIIAFVDNLSDSSVILGARAWVPTELYWTTRWDLIENIKLEFDKGKIEIPFRQLEIHVSEKYNTKEAAL